MSQTYGPYTPIRSAGGWYFVSGQVGIDADTKKAADDAASQARQAIDNLEQLLAAHSLSLGDIVKTTVFLKNMDDFAGVNEVYIERFPEPRPARSCVAVAELPRVAGDTELLVEIEAVAYKPEQPGLKR